MATSPDLLLRWQRPWTVLCLALVVPFALAFWRTPAPAEAAPQPLLPEPEPPPVIEPRLWSVLQPSGAAEEGELESTIQRFRLAGTYLSYAPAAGNEPPRPNSRYAILDDQEGKRQVLAGEGDRLPGGFHVVDISSDQVVLEQGGRRHTLRRALSPLARAAAEPEEEPDPEKPAVPFWDLPALETSRFGKRIAENQWVLQRDKVMDYYRELLENPERLVNLYRSFHPDRQNGQVEGFRLKFAGEQDFLSAMGIREGDTVRMVNSMKMSSQRRAEFFIGEFVRNNIEALVFDIERDGKEEQLIYLLR
jgi:type II secretion system protein C